MWRWLVASMLLATLGGGLPPRLEGRQTVHRRTLDNGLQVVVVDNAAVPLATALVAVHNGAFTQQSDEAGLAHLYEHILFRSFGSSSSAFALAVTRLKGTYNGTTSEEVVNYFVTVPSSNIRSAIGLLADLMRKAHFSNGDLREERAVVLNELQRGESDPEYELQRRVERVLWGDGWHRKDVGGDSSSLQGISADRLNATYARYYVPNNAALIVTGDVDPAVIFETAAREFREWRAAADPFADRPIPTPQARTNTTAVMVARSMLDVTIVVAMQGPSVSADPGATYAADVLFDIFNDPSSGFQQRLVDRGPFRSISGQYLTLDHSGPIQIRGKTTPEQAPQALLAVTNELDNLDLLIDQLSSDDLAIAKKRRQVMAALERERTALLAPVIASWWSAAGIDYYLSYDDHMAAQTIDSLRRFARQYVIANPRVIGVLGTPRVVGQIGDWLREGGRQPPAPQPPPARP